jgi:hypothetical protein
MFPPIENVVLQSNPQFASLHKQLAALTLNPNGSTKSQERSRDTIVLDEVISILFRWNSS